MSTKIYNGYIIAGQTLSSVQPLTERLRLRAVSCATTLYAKVIADKAVRLIDLHALGRLTAGDFLGGLRGGRDWVNDGFVNDYDLTPSNPLYRARTEITNRQRMIKSSDLRDPEVDFEMKVTFIETCGLLLCLLHTEQKELCKLFEAEKEVKRFFLLEQHRPTLWGDKKRVGGTLTHLERGPSRFSLPGGGRLF